MSHNIIVRGYPATSEQASVIHAIVGGESDVMINAFSGTGKTSTLIGVAENVAPSLKIVYLAFSATMGETSKPLFKGLNVVVKTTHGYAMPFILYPNETPRNYNYSTSEIANMFSIKNSDAYLLSKEFETYCNSSSPEIPPSPLSALVKEFFDKMDGREIQITHSFYLKKFQLNLLNNVPMRIPTIDILMIDEYQDTNDVTKSIVSLLPTKQTIKVGDFYQSIFAFRGATNAMADHKGTKYYLTGSFRFGEEIANMASRFLSTFRGESIKIKGLGKTTKAYTAITLSRTNAFLVKAIMDFIEADKYYKTIREPSLIFDLPINIALLNEGNKDLVAKKFISLTWELEKYERNHKHEFECFAEYLVKTGQKDGNLENVWAGKLAMKYSFRELQDAFDKTIQNNRNSDVCSFFVGTAHSAKGLEFDLVKLTEDFRDFFTLIARWFVENEEAVGLKHSSPIDVFRENAKGGFVPSEILEEFNLFYVAITRAKVKVFFDSVPDYTKMSDAHINKELKIAIKEEAEKQKAFNSFKQRY